jgi:hypothetical protein
MNYGVNYYRVVSYTVNGVAVQSRFAPIIEQEITDVSLAADYLKKFALQRE